MKRFAVLAAVCSVAALAPPPVPAAGIEVGQPFPELVLPDLETGKPTSLARFRGRPLALHVFASW